MLGLAALFLATASASIPPSFAAAAPWWERITYTLRDDGGQQSCWYESSSNGVESCGEEEPVPAARASGTPAGTYTKITFERRFTPGTQPDRVSLGHGDTFLGGQVLAIAIDGSGTVRNCKVVATSGQLQAGYGCKEVRAERFETGTPAAGGEVQQGFITVLVYGHEEQLA